MTKPFEAEPFKEKGNKLLQQEKYEEALRAYSKAIELNPNSAIYYANRSLGEGSISLEGFLFLDFYFVAVYLKLKKGNRFKRWKQILKKWKQKKNREDEGKNREIKCRGDQQNVK